jgi:ABC-type multidrug transport system ATPase subunit
VASANVTQPPSPPPFGSSRSTKELLGGVSSEVCAGELFAVMGARGSGKLTLVDGLGGRSREIASTAVGSR